MDKSDRDIIEAFLERTRGLSQVEAARRAQVGQHSVSRWRRGDRSPLRQPTRRALLTFLQNGRVEADTGEGEVASPDYDSLGIELPGYERLHDRPRREFDRFMIELIAAGLGREDLEELGRGLLNPIAALNTLHKGREESDASSEEDQMLIVQGMIPVLRKIVRERWRK